MPSQTIMDKIATRVKDELSGTDFSCDDLTALSGGNANFVFRGQLIKKLPDGTQEVLIKHGEPYVRTNEAFSLPTTRCIVEADSLATLAHLPAPSPSPHHWFNVRTPALHHFDPQTSTQIQEYLPNGIDLKTYALKHFSPPTPPSQKAQCLALGHSLGRWLKSFHTWTTASPLSPQVSALRTTAAANKALQQLKHATYYDYLLNLVDKFPSILSSSKDTFTQVQAMATAELQDDAALTIVHGDFWTGNVLLSDAPIVDNSRREVFVVDWEVLSLGVTVRDVGQMIAELWMLGLFRGIEAGSWLVEGFLEGYGGLDLGGKGEGDVDVDAEELAYRTVIHVGCHLVVIGGTVDGWAVGEGDVERVVGYGRDLVVKGWARDRGVFEGEGAVLGGLLGGGEASGS